MTSGPVSPPGLGLRTFVVLAVVYLYAFPYFSQLRSANEMPRILMTQELVDHGTFALDARLSDMGSMFDTARSPNGHIYQNKAPGPSFLAVPAYALLRAFGWTSMAAVTWAFRVSVCTIPAVIFLFFFYRFSRRFTPSESARRLALLAFALGSPALPYALVFMSHQPAAVSVGGAFILAVSLVRDTPRRPFSTALGVGFLGAMGVMMDYQTVIASTLIGLYVLICHRRRLPNTAAMALGAAPIVVVLGVYHKICFGGVMTTGYTYAADTVTRRGFLGMVGPSWESFYALVLDPANGILVLAPWCVLGLVGFGAIMATAESRRRLGAEAVVCLSIVVGLVFMLTSLYPTFARAGWCVGPRYMTAALPFLGWLAVAGFAALESNRLLRTLSRALVVTAVIIFVVGSTTYPHWPDALKNPLYELSFRLLGDNYAVRSLGTSLGFRGFVSILPLYLIAAGVTWHLLGAGRKDAAGLRVAACVLGIALVGGYSFFPRSGPYADRAYGFVTGTWEPKKR